MALPNVDHASAGLCFGTDARNCFQDGEDEAVTEGLVQCNVCRHPPVGGTAMGAEPGSNVGRAPHIDATGVSACDAVDVGGHACQAADEREKKSMHMPAKRDAMKQKGTGFPEHEWSPSGAPFPFPSCRGFALVCPVPCTG